MVFAALNNSNFTYSLGGNQTIPVGDSVVLSAPGFESYLWSTLDTASSVTVKTSETVFVELTNSSGCKGFSDTVNIIVTGLTEYSKGEISIYPNPSVNQVNIDMKNTSIKSILVINSVGEIVRRRNLSAGENKIVLDLTGLSGGVYSISLNSKNDNYIQKIIVLDR